MQILLYVMCVTDSFGSKNWAVDSDKIVGGGEIIYFDNVFVWNCIFKKSIIISEDISFIEVLMRMLFLHWSIICILKN